MRNALILAAALTLFTGACTQKTESETEVTTAGGVTTTETESVTTPAIDTAATAHATSEASDAARDAAHATGTAMETAGQEIQRETSTTSTQP